MNPKQRKALAVVGAIVLALVAIVHPPAAVLLFVLFLIFA